MKIQATTLRNDVMRTRAAWSPLTSRLKNREMDNWEVDNWKVDNREVGNRDMGMMIPPTIYAGTAYG